jgi:hypothetical protein
MPQSLQALMSAIANASQKGALFETYASSLAGPVADFAQSVLQNPTQDGVRDWLTLYARLSALSVEGPAEATATLLEQHKAVFEAAEASLAPQDREAIAAFAASLAAKDLTLDELVAESASLSKAPQIEAAPSAPPPPTLVRFTISQSFDGSRVRLYQGSVSIVDRTGAALGTFQARTGGFVADFKTHNGPIPPGLYKIDASLTPIAGMTLNGVSFCFLLAPAGGTDVFGRSGLCIHPDGPPPGTHGCIGINESADVLNQCSQTLADLRAGGSVGVFVEYEAAPDV